MLDHLQCLSMRLRIERFCQSRGGVLDNFSGSRIKLPQSHAQRFESLQKRNSRRRGCRRKHQNGPIGEMPITGCLSQPLAPIFQFGFNSGELNPALERQRAKILACFFTTPGKPNNIGTAVTSKCEFTTACKGISRFGQTGEVSPLKLSEKISFTALRRGVGGQITARVMTPKTDDFGFAARWGRFRDGFHPYSSTTLAPGDDERKFSQSK